MQRKMTILAASAAMAVGAMAYRVSADDPNNPNPAVTPSGDRVASEARQVSPSAKEVRQTVSEATSAAVQGKFSDMEKRFAKADRDRLGDEFKDNQSLRDRWTQFNNDWKNKYNQDFDSSNIAKALDDSSVQIFQGQYMGRARTAGERMNPDNTRTGTGTDVNKPDSQNAENRAGENNSGAFSRDNTAKGDDAGLHAMSTDKDTATIFFASSHSIGPAWAVLRNEGGIGNNWKIDVPDVTPQSLSDSLTQHVIMVQDQKTSWPADVNDAYRMVTHHVLTALADTGGMHHGDMDRTHQPQVNEPGSTNPPR
jgi:hypothetical protein